MNNEKLKPTESSDTESKALDKLEEMWDKKILKGDEEFYESIIPNRHKQTQNNSDEKQEPVKRQRRRRI